MGPLDSHEVTYSEATTEVKALSSCGFDDDVPANFLRDRPRNQLLLGIVKDQEMTHFGGDQNKQQMLLVILKRDFPQKMTHEEWVGVICKMTTE